MMKIIDLEQEDEISFSLQGSSQHSLQIGNDLSLTLKFMYDIINIVATISTSDKYILKKVLTEILD